MRAVRPACGEEAEAAGLFDVEVKPDNNGHAKITWKKIADRRDWVAFDTHLADDYEPNAQGVKVEDDLVIITYVSPKTGRANEHKSYGYLRAPELSRLIRAFI